VEPVALKVIGAVGIALSMVMPVVSNTGNLDIIVKTAP